MNEEIIKKIVKAWYDRGSNPQYHDDTKRKLETMWPTLYVSIKELVEANKDKYE